MVDRQPIKDKQIDAAVAASGARVEGAPTNGTETKTMRDIIGQSDRNAHVVLKDAFPFVSPDSVQSVTDNHLRAQLDETTKVVIKLTDPEAPQMYLQILKPKKDRKIPKSYTTVPLLDFSTTPGNDEKSVTLSPALKDVTKYPPLLVDTDGLSRQDKFHPGASVSETVKDADNLVDVLTTLVPFNVLAGAKEVDEIHEGRVEIAFGRKSGEPAGKRQETRLVINLQPEEGKPHAFVRFIDGPNVRDHSLEGMTTIKDGNAVVFAPPRDEEGRYEGHQIKLSSEGAKQLLRSDELEKKVIANFVPRFLSDAERKHQEAVRAAAVLADAERQLARVTGRAETTTPENAVEVAEGVTLFDASQSRLVGTAGREEDSALALARQAELFGLEPTYDAMALTTTANRTGPLSLTKTFNSLPETK